MSIIYTRYSEGNITNTSFIGLNINTKHSAYEGALTFVSEPKLGLNHDKKSKDYLFKI